MRYRSLTGTDLTVSCVALGTAEMGSVLSVDQSFEMLDRFIQKGGTVLDTAHNYADWTGGEKSLSEKTLGKWLKIRGMYGKVVVSTKGGHPPMDNMDIIRINRQELTKDIDESLQCLGMEAIDLYWVHKDDIRFPIGEVLETLNEAHRAGKIRHFGCSNMRLERLLQADQYAREHGLRSFCGVQVLWSLVRANPCVFDDPRIVGMDEQMHAHCTRTGTFAFCFTSQARGFLERVNRNGLDSLEGWVKASYYSEKNMGRLERVRRLAVELETSLASIGLAFLTSQPFPTIPLMGCLNVAELESSLGAADLQLSADQVRFLIGNSEIL